MESKGIERRAYITLPRDVFYLTAQKNPTKLQVPAPALEMLPLCARAGDSPRPPRAPQQQMGTPSPSQSRP